MAKTEKVCIVCGNDFKGTAKAKCCGSNCRVKLKRLLEKGQQPEFRLVAKKEPPQKQQNNTKNIETDLPLNGIPTMPVRKEGENPFDYAERKNEWKKKYGQLC